MARATFGGTPADFVVRVGSTGELRATSAVLTMWTAQTGGSQVTDLLLGGAPTATITVGTNGVVPVFQGPDGVFELWADAGSGRARMTAPAAVVDHAVAVLAGNPASELGAALSASIDAALPRYDALAPLIYRMKRNEPLKLGVSSSSSLMNPPLPIEGQTGQQMWRHVLDKYGNTASTIEGRGGSGASVEHLLNGGVSPDMMPAEAAARIGYDALLMNINYDNDTARGTSAALFYDRFLSAIRAVQRVGCIPVVIPPLKAGVYFSGTPQDYETAVYKAAADAGAVLFPIQDTLLLPDGSGVDPTYYQADMLHPNTAGAIKYGEAFAALWPAEPQTAAPGGRRARGTWDDPQIVGRFFHWTDALGNDRRTVWNVRKSDSDGRLAATPVLLDPATWARNSAFTADMRNPGSGEVVYDCTKTVGESDGYLGSALGDSTNDATYLTNGGVNCAGTGMFTIPVAGKRDLQFGRDYVTLRLVVNNLTAGADQTLWSRRNLSGGTAQCRVWIDNTTGELAIDLANTNTRIASPGIVGTGKAHVITITATNTTNGVTARCYIDGVNKGTLSVGTTALGSAYASLPFRVGATVTGGGGFAFMLRGEVHWAEVAACYTDRAEEAKWISDRLKPALAGRSLTFAV